MSGDGDPKIYSSEQFKELEQGIEPLKSVRADSVLATWIFRGIIALFAASTFIIAKSVVTKEEFKDLQKSVSEMSAKIDLTVYKMNVLEDHEKRIREMERETYKKKGGP
jgi:hypothetical protein